MNGFAVFSAVSSVGLVVLAVGLVAWDTYTRQQLVTLARRGLGGDV